MGLYAELLSGTAFTAPRAENRRTWMYRRRPSVGAGPCEPLDHATLKTGAAEGVPTPPDPLRWHALPVPETQSLDFVDGLHTMAVNGDPDAGVGIAVHVALANRSMQRAFVDADGEMLVVPQQGRLHVTTELGGLEVRPGEILLLPRGLAFRVAVDGPTRGLRVRELRRPVPPARAGADRQQRPGQPARLPLAPVAAFDADPRPTELVRKSGGRLWRTTTAGSPFDVVAWHGNLVPFKYDTARFMTIGTVSFDHPDPSIFTVLTSPSDSAGRGQLRLRHLPAALDGGPRTPSARPGTTAT
jgi:homogentisate 1,2-dioxygenase